MLWSEARLVFLALPGFAFYSCKMACNCDVITFTPYEDFVITISIKKFKTDQYQIRLSHELRAQLEEQTYKDGDKTLATWIPRVLRKELQTRGIVPKG